MTARTKTRTTTVRLPERIYELARRVVEREKKGTSGASASLNDLIVTAVTSYLNIYQRKQIDAAFAGMAEDADYQNEAKLLAEEFKVSDWEAFRLEEMEQTGEEFHERAASR